MSIRETVLERACGNRLRLFWRLFFLRARTSWPPARSLLTVLLCRSARRHGGYVGPGAQVEGVPSLPHGLHGVYISRFARVGAGCRIYQNVTVGEVDGRAPHIGRGCLIGANAVLVGPITVGDGARIGAGAVVACDVPPGATVVAQAPRILPGGGK